MRTKMKKAQRSEPAASGGAKLYRDGLHLLHLFIQPRKFFQARKLLSGQRQLDCRWNRLCLRLAVVLKGEHQLLLPHLLKLWNASVKIPGASEVQCVIPELILTVAVPAAAACSPGPRRWSELPRSE